MKIAILCLPLTVLNQIVLLFWILQAVSTNQNDMAVRDMLKKSFDELIDGYLFTTDTEGTEVIFFLLSADPACCGKGTPESKKTYAEGVFE